MDSVSRIFQRLRDLLTHQEKRRVISNMFYLTLLQGSTYILSFLTFPYLTRVLGPALMGRFAVATSIINYCTLFVDFGFSYTATREIAIARQDTQKTSEIFHAVMAVKTILATLAFLGLLALIGGVPSFRQNALVILLSFTMTIGQMLYPTWFFQGMEKMQYVTIFNILAKTLSTLAIFLFVRGPQNYLLYPLLWGGGFVVSGLASLWIVYHSFRIAFVRPPLSLIRSLLHDTKYIFFSSLITSVYGLAPVLLSFYVPSQQVGYLDGANRIIEISKTALVPVATALYPYLSHKAHHEKEHLPVVIRKILLLTGAFSFLFSLFLFLGAPWIIRIVVGPNYTPSIPLLRIMSFLVFFASINSILGTQTYLALKENKAYTALVGIRSGIFLLLSFVFLPLWQARGMAWVQLLTEILLTFLAFFYLLVVKKFPLFRKYPA